MNNGALIMLCRSIKNTKVVQYRHVSVLLLMTNIKHTNFFKIDQELYKISKCPIENILNINLIKFYLTEALEIVEKVENSINILLKNETSAVIKNKFVDVISKNTGLKLLL